MRLGHTAGSELLPTAHVKAEAPAWAQAMEKNIIGNMTKELAPVKAAVEECKVRLGKTESTIETHDQRITQLEQAISGSPAGASWTPKHVKIKGFCDFKDEKVKGVTRAQASELMQKIVSWLPSDLKPHVKDFQLRSARNYSITGPITPQYLQEISNTWKDNFKLPENRLTDGRDLFVTVQRKPEVEKQYGVMGKLIDFAEDNCEGTSTVKPFWSPDFEVYVEPAAVDEGLPPPAIRIAKVGLQGVVSWDPAGLKLLSLPDGRGASEKLDKFRRK